MFLQNFEPGVSKQEILKCLEKLCPQKQSSLFFFFFLSVSVRQVNSHTEMETYVDRKRGL